jgi:hypothetical protein
MKAARVPWRRLGEVLVGHGLITEQELERALAEQLRPESGSARSSLGAALSGLPI